jgi:SAM-dependent methyltransferase
MWDSAERHLGSIRTALGVNDVSGLRGFEFGAGWHLGVAVALAAKGVGEQTIVDRSPLALPQLVRHTVRIFAERHPDNRRLTSAAGAADVEGLLNAPGIRYVAPVDARATGLPPGSFDFVTSTSTLEHIPECDLDDLLIECRRLLRPGGAFTATIDYGDHYAQFDPSITSLNFLRYSPERWRLYSPPFQFQNRLRHSDYVARFEAAGLRPVAIEAVEGTDRDREWVARTQLHPSFDHYELEDLLIGDAHIVCLRA